MSDLSFSADIDLTKLSQSGNRINSELTKIAQQAANSGSIIDNSFNKAGKSAALLGNDVNSLQRNLLGLASVATLGRLGQQIITIRGEFQQLGIAFETMLGSKEKADKMMQDAVTFAAKTPFTLTDVASNIKQLLAMGIAEKDVMGTLKALGDVSAGVSVDLSRVALNYGQVATTGKLMGKEMRDFMVAGIPLSAELAKNLGVTKAEIDDMVTAGKIGFPDVAKAFQTMSGEGGMFFNLMEKQSLSVTGQISNLSDKLDTMFNSLGKANEGLIYDAISGLSSVVDNYESILKVLGVLITTYGTYRAALMLSAAAQTVSTTAGVYDIATKNLAIGATLRAAAAQSTLNATIMANPYVAAAAGIAALISIIYVLSEKAKTADDYIQELNDSMAQIGKQIEIEETVQKFTELDTKVVKTKAEQEDYNKTLQKLATIFPEAIGQTDQYGKAVDLIKDKLIAQNKELRDNLVLVSEKKAQEAQKSLNDLLDDQVKLQNQINTGKQVTTVKNPRAGQDQIITTIFTSEEISKKREELAVLAQSIAQFGSTVQKENADILKLKTIEANEILSGYKELFAGVTTFSKQQAIDAKSALQKITTPEGSVASTMVKEQISAIDEYILKLKTTGTQVKQWQAELAAAKEKLKQINDENYTSLDPAKDKADQEEIIKTLSEKLGLKKQEKKAVDELKAAQEALEKAIISGDQSAVKAAAERITGLEKEKKLIQDKIDLEMQAAWRRQFDGQSMTPVQSKGVTPITQIGSLKSVQGILYEVTAIDKTGPVWTKVKAQYADLKKFEKDQDAKGKKEQDELDRNIFENKKRNQEDLLNYSRQFTSELIDQLGLTEDEAKQLNSMADIVASLASGNFLAAGFSAASLVLSALGAKKEDPTTKALENVNALLEKQSAILSNLAGSNYFELAQKQYDDFGKSIDLNNKKLQDSTLFTKKEWTSLQAQFKQWQKDFPNPSITFDTWVKNQWSETNSWTPKNFIDAYTEGSAALNDQQIEWINSIVDLQTQQAELLQETFRTALGFDSSDVSDSIFSGIDEGLKLGENSLGGFAQSFGDLMKQALMQSVTDAMNMDITNTFLPEYQKAIEDAIISPEERANLESIYSNLIRKAETDSANIQSITGQYTTSASSSLTGISSQMTEETGSLVAGEFMAMRVDIKTLQETGMNQLELMDQSLSALNQIAKNTQPIYRLEAIENGIKEMNINLKNLG